MRRRGPLIAGLIAAVVAGLVFFLIVNPKMREVGDTQEELEQARTNQLTLETELARLRALRDQAPELRERLAELRREVPPVADLPGLVNKLQDIADRAAVEFFSISPGTPTPSPAGTAAVIPAEIQVVGGFFSVDEFLFRLEEMNRAAKVISIAITSGVGEAADGGTVQVSSTETVLTVALSVEFYTTDTTAGPGAPVGEAEEAAPEPGASPSPGASPTPTPSPMEEA